MNSSADNYYGGPLHEAAGQGDMLSMSDYQGMSGMGNTLDDIVAQNRKELERRRSMEQSFSRTIPAQHADLRRASMMEFGSGHDGSLDGYQFNPSPVTGEHTDLGMEGQRTPMQDHMENGMRRQSAGELALTTQFGDSNPAFNAMRYSDPFQSPMTASDPLNFDITGGYSPTAHPASVGNSLSLGYPTAALEPPTSSGDVTPVNHFAGAAMPPHFSDLSFAPVDRSGAHGMQNSDDPGGGNTTLTGPMESGEDPDMMDSAPSIPVTEQMPVVPSNPRRSSIAVPNNAPPTKLQRGVPPVPSTASIPPGAPSPSENVKNENAAVIKPEGPHTSPFPHRQQEKRSMFSGVYSSSGFDMVKILSRVENRVNPEIDLGSVDMSCAFVVCDVTQHDLPIVYCSDVFERLTGYSKHEILGRNCRFLQAPDGKVTSGVKRKYVDDDVVLQLKNKITARKEAQTSIINYRKGGQPFMNLLTLIPITCDADDIAYKYYVGFQVDLVETPQSVTKKNSDGSYSINYSRGFLPRYVWQTPETIRNPTELGQTIPRDEVSAVLTTIGSGENELTKRLMDKVLLENTDDVVHVLSLKGLFLYLSPSSRKILEYDSAELVGTALSSVCHPSDIVPVTRELKDTSTGASVNVVFRIRRKHSGYTWFESHGSLHTEQGKGRKCIILVGRERPVYALSRNDIVAAGGIGESELWTKMSTSGMFLYVSSNVRTLLDRQPEELVGTSIQGLMRSESKLEFDRVLESARTGRRVTVKHEMQNKRGQVLQANTTIYPGDATEGQKPTFLVAQTRFSKLNRTASSLSASKPLPTTPRTDVAAAASTSKGANANPAPVVAGIGATPTSGAPASSAVSPTRSNAGPSPPQVGIGGPLRESVITEPGGRGLSIGSQDVALAAPENVFDELKTTRSTSWQFELRQMEKRNRLLVEELQALLSSKKKRKRRKGAGQLQKDCANCHTRTTPEWRRGPSGNRDLCNSCGLRWAKQNGRVSPRTSSQQSDKQSASPGHTSPLDVEKPPAAATAGAAPPASAGGSSNDTINNNHPNANNDGNTTSNISMGPPPDRRSLSSGAASQPKSGSTTDSNTRFDSNTPSFSLGSGTNSITKIEEEDE